MASFTESIAAVEGAIHGSVSREIPWDLVTNFMRFIRESGTEGEWKAAHYIHDKLRGWGANVTMLTPELLISVPREAKLEVAGLGPVRAKTPAFSVSTPGVEAEAIYVPAPKVHRIEDM